MYPGIGPVNAPDDDASGSDGDWLVWPLDDPDIPITAKNTTRRMHRFLCIEIYILQD